MGKAMAYLVLLSSCLSAFCLSVMAVTLVTGELPFGMSPVMKFDEEAPALESDNAPVLEPEVLRVDESFGADLYRELRTERERLNQRAVELEDRQRVVEELAANARKLQDEVAEAEERIRKLLDVIDKTEVDNIKNLASLLAGLESNDAAAMLMELDGDKAARILYYMDEKSAGKLLASVIQGGKPDEAAKLANAMHKLTDTPLP